MTRHAALILAALTMACADDVGGTASESDPTTTDPTTTDPTTTTDPATTDPSTDPTTTTDPATTDPSTDPTTTTDPSTDTTADSTGTTDGTTTDPTDASSSDDGVTTGEPSELEVALVDVSLYMNCKPIVPPDPLIGSGWLELDNGGPDIASITVTSVRLLIGGDAEAAAFDIAPSDLGGLGSGENDSIAWDKTMGSLEPANGCETLECGAFYTLEVVLDVDGGYAVATEDVVVECAF